MHSVEAALMKPFYGHSGSWINEKTHFQWKRDWWKYNGRSGSGIDAITI